jgi:integrase/recombinase XerC
MLPMSGIDKFLIYLQSEKRYAPHTITAYRNDLNGFLAFCLERGSDSFEFSEKAVRGWVVYLMDTGYATRTVHRKLTSLRTYCKFLIINSKLDSNPVDRIRKPRLNKRVPAFVEEDKMERLLEDFEFGEDFVGVRNRLIIDILYQTGIRRSELTGLKLHSIDTSNSCLRVLGKRSKERIIPLNPELEREICDYLNLRREIDGTSDNEALLVTSHGKPAYDKLVYRVVNRYLALVTTLAKRSPHLLRHTFATHMLNHGADLNAIKELLGHANLSATQIYTHNTFKKLKSIYNQAHPRA